MPSAQSGWPNGTAPVSSDQLPPAPGSGDAGKALVVNGDEDGYELQSIAGANYLGTYVSVAALEAAYPTASAGNHAYVNEGIGSDATLYIWDDDDSEWVVGGSGTMSGSEIETILDAYYGNADWRTPGDMSGADIVSALNTELGSTDWQGDGAADGDIEARFWRLASIDCYDAGNTPSASGIEFRDTDDVRYTGTFDASSVYSGAYPITNAGNNDNVSTLWSANASDNDVWVELDLGVGNVGSVKSVMIRARNDSFPLTTIGEFTLEYSDDGVSWTAAGTITDTSGDPTSGEVRVHDVSEFTTITSSTAMTGAEIEDALDAEIGTDWKTGTKYLGTYVSLAALQAAHATASPGNHAHVNAGIGTDVVLYLWDDDDSEWVVGGSGAMSGSEIETVLDAYYGGTDWRTPAQSLGDIDEVDIDTGSLTSQHSGQPMIYDHPTGKIVIAPPGFDTMKLGGGEEVIYTADLSLGTFNAVVLDEDNYDIHLYDEIRIVLQNSNCRLAVEVSSDGGVSPANLQIWSKWGDNSAEHTSHTQWRPGTSDNAHTGVYMLARIMNHSDSTIPTNMESFGAASSSNTNAKFSNAINAVTTRDNAITVSMANAAPSSAGYLTIIGVKKSRQPLEFRAQHSAASWSIDDQVVMDITMGAKFRAGVVGRVELETAPGADADFSIVDGSDTEVATGTVLSGETSADLTAAGDITVTDRLVLQFDHASAVQNTAFVAVRGELA